MRISNKQPATKTSRHRDYQRGVRNIAADWFKAKSLPASSKYAYCLRSREQWRDNIILADVVKYIEEERKARAADRLSFPLHKWLHHGLSSQAMLINLVGPLIVRNDLEPLRIAFEAAGVPWPVGNIKASLEVEDRRLFNERQAQPTSIDLVLQNDSGSALFVEAKFVEQGFGGCSIFEDGDCSGSNPAKNPSLCYLHRVGRTYWERMEQLGFLQPPMTDCRICPLASYYQFFRETVFAISKGGHFVLLSDDRSPVFFRRSGEGDSGLLEFLSSFVPMEHRCRVHAVTIQAVAKSICQSKRHDDWIDEFMNKYGIERE